MPEKIAAGRTKEEKDEIRNRISNILSSASYDSLLDLQTNI